MCVPFHFCRSPRSLPVLPRPALPCSLRAPLRQPLASHTWQTRRWRRERRRLEGSRQSAEHRKRAAWTRGEEEGPPRQSRPGRGWEAERAPARGCAPGRRARAAGRRRRRGLPAAPRRTCKRWRGGGGVVRRGEAGSKRIFRRRQTAAAKFRDAAASRLQGVMSTEWRSFEARGGGVGAETAECATNWRGGGGAGWARASGQVGEARKCAGIAAGGAAACICAGRKPADSCRAQRGQHAGSAVRPAWARASVIASCVFHIYSNSTLEHQAATLAFSELGIACGTDATLQGVCRLRHPLQDRRGRRAASQPR